MIKKFSVSYCNADASFEIHNMKQYAGRDDLSYSILCVVENIIQRGRMVGLSRFLKEYYGENQDETFYNFFSDSAIDWGNLIKGDEISGYNPAKIFYYNILPSIFEDYPFVPQLFVPEVLISDIVNVERSEYKNQRVDFYCPEAKLVIEIDGSHHQYCTQKYIDESREDFLANNGIVTVRIPTKCFLVDNDLEPFAQKIKDIVLKNISEDMIRDYLNNYIMCVEKKVPDRILALTATIRLQIALIEMCKAGDLSLSESRWSLAIKTDEISGYERVAIVDLFNWIENIFKLAGETFTTPEVEFADFDSRNSSTKAIHIKLTTPLGNAALMKKNVIYVTASARRDVDYFSLAIAKPIKYVVDDSGKNSFAGNSDGLNSSRLALRFILRNIFGFDSFRNGQERIIMNALKGNDTIGVLPTGTGKSICYQLPLILQPCISFCVCPIKSLMIDQDLNLKDKGIGRTAFLTSDISAEERTSIQKGFAECKYWWIYISPERFQDATFRQYMSNMTKERKIFFGYGVIDEVHCLSEWGHSFRVSYLNLVKTIRKFCQNITMIGLTATASFNVLKNIQVEFGMKDKNNVISIPSFTREELNFRVVKTTRKQHELQTLLASYRKVYPDIFVSKGADSRCGIIFTPFVNGNDGCYLLSKHLSYYLDAEVRCFAGETPKKWVENEDVVWDKYKHDAQSEFKENYYTVLCATKAFGMGIDKPNVRYTVHYGIPSSLEALYQEAGRAGRDKKKATCTILYTPEDTTVYTEKEDEKEKEDGEIIEPLIPTGMSFDEYTKYLLTPEATVEEIRKFTNDKRVWKGKDATKQLFLLSNGLLSSKEEVEAVLQKILPKAKSGRKVVYSVDYQDDLQGFQTYIYHLSIIGVIEDWTVSWKGPTVDVSFTNYATRDILGLTERYIRYYEADFDITKEDDFKICDEKNEEICIALRIFLDWYSRTIVYSRRQALLNVIEACERYTDERAADFKDEMEAYFRLDDVADVFGDIADEPREFREWFIVLIADRLKKSKNSVRDTLISLNRFLESYQHNVGLNYISGILNIIQNSFDSPNGEARLQMALNVINTFNPEDKLYIVTETAKLFRDLGKPDEGEIFSEYMIEHLDYDGTDRAIYKIIEDNFSLWYFLNKKLRQLCCVEE